MKGYCRINCSSVLLIVNAVCSDVSGGKKKPLKQPKKDDKDLDEVNLYSF